MKKVIMLGTRFDTMGGISSVVNVYRQAGLFARYPVHYLATHCDGGPWTKLRLAMLAWLRFVWLLLCGQAGLVHIHVASRASFWRKSLFFFTARLFRVPVILHLHGGGFHVFYDESGKLAKWWIRHVYDHAARVIVLSQTWQTWVQSISHNPHVIPIYNPVVVPPWHALQQAPIGSKVLVLGRLSRLKGSFDLLDAVQQIAPRFPDLQLAMGGDGQLQEVSEHAARLGLSGHLHLLGWVRGAAKDQALQTARVFVLPSYNEGMPMSVLEAMAAGLPLITTAVGGIPEVVRDGVEGFLITPGDIAQLAERLTRLMQDDELVRQMGQAGRARVESTFSTDAILPRIESLYQELGIVPSGKV